MKKRILLGLSMLLFVCLTACGITSTTTMDLNHDFTGKRSITCTIEKSNRMADNINAESLDTLIADHCPDVMTYQNKSDEQQFAYTFELSFSSYDDYKDKVDQCLNFAPKIRYTYGNSPFQTGLILSENFTSPDLLCWFSEALEKEGYIDDSKKLWGNTSSTLLFDGKEYELNDEETISITEMSYLPLTKIRMYTEETKHHAYHRMIVFEVPKESLDQSGAAIRNYLTGDLDKDRFQIKWNGTQDGKECQIRFTAKSLDQLSQYTNEVLKSDGSTSCKVSYIDGVPFQLKKCYKDHYDLSKFASSPEESISYEIYYKPDSASTLDDYEAPDDSGYFLIQKKENATISAAYNLTHVQAFRSYQLSTVYYSGNLFRKELVLTGEINLTEEERTAIEKDLRSSGFQDIQWIDSNKVRLICEGKPDAVASGFHDYFQGETSLKVSTKKEFFQKNTSTIIDDVVDLSYITWEETPVGTYYFISNSDESMKNVTFDSTTNASAVEKLTTIEENSLSDITELTKLKGSYKASIHGASLHAVYTGGVSDVIGSFFIIIALIIILIGTLIIIAYKHREPLFAFINAMKERYHSRKQNDEEDE